MTTTPKPTLPAHRLRRVAVAADADPRSVAKVLAGLPTRASVYERIVAALRAEAPEIHIPGDSGQRQGAA